VWARYQNLILARDVAYSRLWIQASVLKNNKKEGKKEIDF
jgi:hypothetical protein